MTMERTTSLITNITSQRINTKCFSITTTTGVISARSNNDILKFSSSLFSHDLLDIGPPYPSSTPPIIYCCILFSLPLSLSQLLASKIDINSIIIHSQA